MGAVSEQRKYRAEAKNSRKVDVSPGKGSETTHSF